MIGKYCGAFALALGVTACASDDLIVLSEEDTESFELEAIRAQNDARIAESVARLGKAPAGSEAVLEELARRNNPETAEEAFQAKLAGTLTPDERSKLETYFALNGVPAETVSFQGRIVVSEGDMYFDADDLLAELDEPREKGMTPVNNGAANPISRINASGQYQVQKPFQTTYNVVTPNTQWVYELVLGASSRVSGVTGDTIPASTWNVMTQSTWDGLPTEAKAWIPVVTVVANSTKTGAGASCADAPGTNVWACMSYPSIRCEPTSSFPCVSRMMLGNRLGIRTDNINGDTGLNRGVIAHEFMHSLGIAHQGFETPTNPGKLYVPGTSTDTNVLSIMAQRIDQSNWRQTPQADDIDVLRTIWAPGQTTSGGWTTVVAN